MTRPYASNVDFRFCSGENCIVDCYSLLLEMSMVGLMSHIAVIEHLGLNRKSISFKISFSRDHSTPVPHDNKSIPDIFGLSIRCNNPKLSGHISKLHCLPDILSIYIDGLAQSMVIRFDDGFLSSLHIEYSSITINSHTPVIVNTDSENLPSIE